MMVLWGEQIFRSLLIIPKSFNYLFEHIGLAVHVKKFAT